jgi:muconate cycloisomerase
MAVRIAMITATEVVVPAHPGAIESTSISRPLHKLPIDGTKGWRIQFDELPKVILQLGLSDGTVGLGELYRGHSWATVDAISRSLLGADIRALCRQDLPFADAREHDGFEIALWDAYARLHGLRVVDLLGGPVRQAIWVGSWTGHRTDEDVASVARRYQQLGFDCLKFKCDRDDDIVGWAATVAREAPGMQVIFDPNERLGRPFVARRLLAELGEVGNVLCLEDPIPHWMRADWADLRAASLVPVVQHVSMPYRSVGNRISDAVSAIQHRMVDGFNFNGGLADFQRLDHLADIAELPCWHGSEVDLGILEAAYLHSCAAARSCTWPSDIFGRHIRSHDLLEEPLAIDPPFARLPDGPGLGVDLDLDALVAHRRAHKEYVV